MALRAVVDPEEVLRGSARTRQPVNIYAEGTPTVRAQANYPSVGEVAQQFNQRFVQPLLTPFQSAGAAVLQSAPAQRIAQDIERSGIRRDITSGAPITELRRTSGLTPTAANQFLQQPTPQTAPAPTAVNTRPDRVGTSTAVRRVGGNATAENLGIGQEATQLQQAARTGRPGVTPIPAGSGYIRNETTGDVVSIDAAGNIVMRNAAGESISRPTRSFRQEGGTPGVSVQFDNTVSPEAQAAFLQQPVRPTAQIDRFNATRGIRNRAAQRQAEQSSINAGQIISPPEQADGDQLFTRENSPDMGWKTRRELNRQILANRQSGINQVIQAGTTQRGQDIAATTASQAQNIDAANVASQIGLRNVQAQLEPQLTQSTIDLNKARTAAELRGKPRDVQVLKEDYESLTKEGGAQKGSNFYTLNPDGSLRPLTVNQYGGLPSAPLPTNKADLKQGIVYQTDKGAVVYNGTKLVPYGQ